MIFFFLSKCFKQELLFLNTFLESFNFIKLHAV